MPQPLELHLLISKRYLNFPFEEINELILTFMNEELLHFPAV
jgi:hypothetical protein